MPVGKLDVFLNAAEIGDILAHAGSRSTVWSQFVDNSSTMPAAFQISAPRSTARPRRYGTTTLPNCAFAALALHQGDGLRCIRLVGWAFTGAPLADFAPPAAFFPPFGFAGRRQAGTGFTPSSV